MGNIFGFGEICSCDDRDNHFEMTLKRDRKEDRIKFTADDDFLSVSESKQIEEVIEEVFDLP